MQQYSFKIQKYYANSTEVQKLFIMQTKTFLKIGICNKTSEKMHKFHMVENKSGNYA